MAYLLRWGLCGAGKIANDFCGAMTTLPKGEHKVVAVASRSRDRVQKFVDKFRLTDAKVYESYKELSKDPNVDVVHIGTIHTNHAELSIMMMNAGKHVLCEKPMAMNLRQAKKVPELAKEKNVFFMESFMSDQKLRSLSDEKSEERRRNQGLWSRTIPNYERIREELANGSLGEIELVTVKFCIPGKGVACSNRREDGAGYLLLFGIYTIQFATMVFDEMPEKIVAEGMLNDEGTDEQVSVILRYKNGKMANIVFSGKTCLCKNSASIHGSRGSIEVPDLFWCPPEVHTPSGVYKNDLPECDVPYNFLGSGGLRYEADYTRKCIREELYVRSTAKVIYGREKLRKNEKPGLYVRSTAKVIYGREKLRKKEKPGKGECPAMSHRHSEIIMTIMDEIRRQIGVVYDADLPSE